MSMLTAAEIEAARADLATLLPDTATIRRRTLASDGGGGQTEEWRDIATVACRLAPAGRASSGGHGIGSGGGRLNDATTHIVTFPAETDAQLADHVVIDSVTYEVLFVRRRGSWELTRRVEVKEAP